MTPAFETVVASAPGKVILFGEHAVVYGVTAIAAALSDLRIFVEISSIPDDCIEVQLYDVIVPPEGKSFSHKITLSKVGSLFDETHAGNVNEPIDPDEDLLAKLKAEFQDAPIAAAQCLMAIMYLIARVIPECLFPKLDTDVIYGGLRFDIKSKGLPIGAGLGSSAAFSVALSAALLRLRQQKQQPFLGLDNSVDNHKSVDVASQFKSTAANKIGTIAARTTKRYIPASLLTIINGWAYAAEVVIHGSPSGLDNTTSCYGGAVRFKKGDASFENIHKEDLPKMRILLTNTKVPRSTKVLVAGVRTLHDNLPKVVGHILESIEEISARFLEIIEKCKQRRRLRLLYLQVRIGEQQAKEEVAEAAEIGVLFRINHFLLNALGVGHESLDAVFKASESNGLPCKLTGAGGGGCAMTLLPQEDTHEIEGKNGSGEVGSSSAVTSAVDRLKVSLGELGFEAFESSLAGDGVQWP